MKRRVDGGWDAVDETLRRPVVVHLLDPGSTPVARQHFTTEARALAGLHHRNLAATYDTGIDEDGFAYRVDELPAGLPLDAEALRRGVGHSVTIATQMARGLAAAHAAGLRHENLVPACVLVTDDERVKLRGFRLAAPGEGDGADRDALLALITRLAPPQPHPLGQLVADWHDAGHAPHDVNEIAVALFALPVEDDAESLVEASPTPPGGTPLASRGHPWRVLGVLGLVAVIALVVATQLPHANRAAAPTAPMVHLEVRATSFDPEAAPPTENEQAAAFAVDGQPSTTWATQQYRSRPFANLKTGVGLILNLTRPARVVALHVRSPTLDWAAQVYAADKAGRTLADWGTPIISRANINGDSIFELDGRRAGSVLLWFTGTGTDRRVAVAELVLDGRP